MILGQQLRKPFSKMGALVFADLIDTLGMVADGEDALPAGDLITC